MKDSTKKSLVGGVAGFGVGVAITGVRLAAASTALVSYPVVGAISCGAVMLYRTKKESALTKAAAVVAGAAFGGVTGLLITPLAMVEPVLAPLTAIPYCTACGASLGNGIRKKASRSEGGFRIGKVL